jgi:hypothetical protein
VLKSLALDLSTNPSPDLIHPSNSFSKEEEKRKMVFEMGNEQIKGEMPHTIIFHGNSMQ